MPKRYVTRRDDTRTFPVIGLVLDEGEFVTVEWHDEFLAHTYTTDDSRPADLVDYEPLSWGSGKP